MYVFVYKVHECISAYLCLREHLSIYLSIFKACLNCEEVRFYLLCSCALTGTILCTWIEIDRFLHTPYLEGKKKTSTQTYTNKKKRKKEKQITLTNILKANKAIQSR